MIVHNFLAPSQLKYSVFDTYEVEQNWLPSILSASSSKTVEHFIQILKIVNLNMMDESLDSKSLCKSFQM
jgi:hypothetical protein